MNSSMNFHLAAKNVRLENNHYLRAYISFNGRWENASLDLDLYIGNNNGALSWGGSNFSLEATNIRLGKDPYGGWCPVLYATLLDSNGVAISRGIYLGRCIGIENSNLSCDISKTHLTEPVRNPNGGINYFILPSQYRRGY